MLTRLELTDFAVISKAVFEPSEGLNVITGETGAGKSLLVDALGLIMGDKASRAVIRTGCSFAYVEAIFDVSSPSDGLSAFLKEIDIEPEDGMLIVSRKISTDGKSIARINGKTVVLAMLRQLSSFLIDIHGQNDTQVIFDEGSNVDLLLSYGGDDIAPCLELYSSNLRSYKETVLKIRNLSQSPEMLAKRREYLEFAVNEIEEAGLKPGEEEELLNKKRRISKLGEMSSSVNEAYELLNEDGVLSDMGRIFSDLEKVKKDDDRLEDIAKRTASALLDLEAIRDDLSVIVREMDFDPSEEEEINRKIGKIYELKSKYGSNIEEILKFKDDALTELDSFEDNKRTLVTLKKERHEMEERLLKSAEELSTILKEKAAKLEKEIVSELADLEMPQARFSVEFTRRPKDRFFSSHGIDDIRFMFSANPGQELKPLSSIVSGGEASRIMLAVKNILSRCDKTPTLIFDEIDMGVSGKASAAIAVKLSSIAKMHQVLCVSHTSQICAAADNNYLLTKSMYETSTETNVTKLDSEGKVDEVARLLSGTGDQRSKDLAKSMIEQFGRRPD